MKIKVTNIFKLTTPPKTIMDIQIIEGDTIVIGQKFINKEGDLEFVIDSIGHVNPPISKYYPLIVTINNDVNLVDFKDKIFIPS
ncbi:hypothetical protein HX13_05790 [Chryseobacterium sp. P1-3]|uniref:hypothetical protein n=1 Tax=Chryseobacterium sp. (strain P1-3) TaxID=1517683 RepID=UPI0004E672C6|nr:hypothetical protein [Chryseobacterium sp. P1-3]KFF75619.1 hypothetical protein HX13_05790 [Chryseobacterium sp. P1-3]